ncbi:MAG TPA: Stk1 family PASTA domain-containing Ser/Thr kinase [bacterium]|nr:Stk1 family PASTA domain-containing Ser/Thr kinase [bacterium]
MTVRDPMAIRKNAPESGVPAPRGAEGSGGEPRLLAGRFELREVLGSGGMATVHRAWDRQRGRVCAVKVLAENLARDEEFRERFRQEAEAASALVHPRIVRVDAHGDAGSTPFIAMEFVEGGTLRDLLRRRERLSEATALRIAAEVADALAYAHARRVIHRDIKPHNILLTADEHVKVADFGIARTLDATSHTRTGTVLGSTQYISPEQAAGEQAAPASDQYSLGVVLYEALAGRLPFDDAESPVAMALKHIHEPPFDLAWIRPDLSEATVALVRRLLAKSPGARYPAAGELATGLRRIYARLGRDEAKTEILPTPISGAAANGVAAIAHGATVRLAAVGRPSVALSDTARTPASSRYRRRNAAPPAAVLLIGLIGLWLLVAVAYQGFQFASHRASAGPHAPSLVGQTLAAAQQVAASDRFTLAIASRQDPIATVGTIAAQDPPAGGTVAGGATIHVVVSEGSGVVPDVRGASPADAGRQLGAAGFRVGSTSYAHDDKVAAGMIASQSVNPGVHLASKTPINVVVSQGPSQASTPSPGTTVVPNVTGVPLDQAQAQLRAAGLAAGHVSYTYDDRVPAGVVVRQQRAAGTQAAGGDAVDLVVSQGPSQPQPSQNVPPAQPAPPDQTAPPNQSPPAPP